MAAFILYLLLESLLHSRRIRRIPLRIAVTGSRGKSSVTRLIASALREAGFSVLAKTTGSLPSLIFPDGREREILRRGPATPLEQKIVLGEAKKYQVQALVAETMSVTPESLSVETAKLLSPHILVITNVRLDHLDRMGKSKEAIARCYASAIPEKSQVFIPEEEFFPDYEKEARKRGSTLIKVLRETPAQGRSRQVKMPGLEFEANLRLALAVALNLGVGKEAALLGLAKAKPDFGSLKIWAASAGFPPRDWFLVSCFAANDPESTRLILSKLWEMKFLQGKKAIGLLNFRSDRADRTQQWLKALKEQAFPEFSKLIVVGDHAPLVRRRLKHWGKEAGLAIARGKSPQEIMGQIYGEEQGDAVLVGMGNMGGWGRALVSFWESMGRPYDL